MDREPPRDDTAIAEFVSTLRFEDLTDEEIRTVERAFVDTVGVGIAGLAEPAARKVRSRFGGIDPIANESAGRAGETTDRVADPSTAGLLIGTAAHALDYDDLSWSTDGHPSVTLVPVPLALAEHAEVSGRDAITAYAAGYETACAVAGPVSPTHYERGWHATATIGSFAAAAAAARLLDLDPERTEHALAIAASTASGLKTNFGSMTKPLHAGLAVRDGITAALLAGDGFTGSPGAISDEAGFWGVYADGPESSFSIGDPRHLDTYGLQVKAYPCCYYTHAAIAATASLADDHAIDPESIRRIDVTGSRAAADALQYAEPSSPTEAKFSMQHAVAAAVITDRVGLQSFEESFVSDDRVRRLRKRVTFHVDENRPYNANGADVKIETANGTVETTRDRPPGTRRDPLTDEELDVKFRDCVERRLSPKETTELSEFLFHLASKPRLGPVLDHW